MIKIDEEKCNGCGDLMQMVITAMGRATVKVPVKAVLVSIDGKILKNEWIQL